MNRPAPRPLRRRARRWLVNPVATLLLLAALLTDAALLPYHNLVGGRSFAGAFVYYGLRGGRTHTMAPIEDVVFTRSPTGLRLGDPAFGTLGDSVALSQSSPKSVLWGHFIHRNDRTGLWAITRDSVDWQLILDPADPASAPSPAEQQDAARLLADYLDTLGTAAARQYAQALRAGGRAESRILWSGYLHNSLSLAAFLALLYSLQWIPKTPAWFRDRRRRRAESRGQCPRCGYTLSGLRPGSPCPECGTTAVANPVGSGTPIS